ELLEDPTLKLTISTMEGVTVTKVFDDIELLEDKDVTVRFPLPTSPRTINVEFSTKVKKMEGGYQKLNASKSWTINQIDGTNEFAVAHLIPQTKGRFIVSVLGKTGEALDGVKVYISAKHHLLSSQRSFNFHTDKKGRVYLPTLQGCNSVSARVGSRTFSWNLNTDQCIMPRSVHVGEGEAFNIPYLSQNNISDDTMMVFKLYDSRHSICYDELVKYGQGAFNIGPLEPGSYTLYADYDSFQASIFVTRTEKVIKSHTYRFAIQHETFTVLSNPRPLRILSIDGDRKKGWNVELEGASSECRVHALATHFIPGHPIHNSMRGVPYRTTELVDFNSPPSIYCQPRAISEEYRYVLEREGAKKYIGNMLQKPSLLLRPFSAKTTHTGTQEAAAGDKIENRKYTKRRRPQEASLRSLNQGNLTSNNTFPNLEFLARSPSNSAFNFKPSKDGNVYIPPELVGANHTTLTI
ncbi:MAG: hypothetical protein GY940_47320, partial [bacterium]|nr:hypothetical protein [bacterium]